MASPRIDIYRRSIEARKQCLEGWKIAAEDKRAVLRFLEELELGKVNKGRKISESRQCKYLDMLRAPLECFGKQTSRLTIRDVERFEKALVSGKIISNKGRAYSNSTKANIREALKIYLRWKLGAKRALELTDWLDTREVMTTPDYLPEVQIDILFKSCKSSAERFLVAVLFDTGARASEFFNIRYEDINLPEKSANYVKVTLKEEYSKTKGRTISLYWKWSLESVRDYVKEREAEGIKREDAIFKGGYDQARFFLMRLGKKVLKRSIHFHLFRHSSATFYATRMNRQQLCYRYGWNFSSRMPDVYISRSGMASAELDQQFTSTALEDVQAQLEREKRQSNITVEGLQHDNRKLHEQLERLTRVVSRFTGQAIPKVEALKEQVSQRKGKAQSAAA